LPQVLVHVVADEDEQPLHGRGAAEELDLLAEVGVGRGLPQVLE
jgi:hypothetical protein